jgi:hypothetical protein
MDSATARRSNHQPERNRGDNQQLRHLHRDANHDWRNRQNYGIYQQPPLLDYFGGNIAIGFPGFTDHVGVR